MRWNLDAIYPQLDGEPFQSDLVRLNRDLDDLSQFCDAAGVGRLPSPPPADGRLASVLEELLERLSQIALRLDRLESYVYARVTTDSRDSAAAREMSRVDQAAARAKQLQARVKGWIGSLENASTAWLAERPSLRKYEFFMSETARLSRYLMSDDLESLAAELCLDAGVAFGKLQGNITSQVRVPLERNGRVEELPITVVQNFRFDPDPELRRRAYEAEVAGWRSIETTVAACLNGVKGTASTLARRRGRASVLEESLDQNRIDRATLDAMLQAIRDALPMFRRYLSAKARKLGRQRLPWWDLFAPLGSATTRFTWAEARGFLIDKFATFDAELAAMTTRAFDEDWIDAEPRDGKRPGAYCMGIVSIEQSRILANFDGSFEQVSTLAHELGHAFHNFCQRGLEPLRRGAPSTLAETASTFCETLIAEATLEHATADEQLMILESQLAGANQVCLDILSRLLFESAVFERRPDGELSASDFTALMREAQRETYGEGVDEATYHPYMWLWKPHYYSHDHNFYNFPYAFGQLFALGLYARYQAEPVGFAARYKELLRDTGQADAMSLAARFGIDIRQQEFWRESLNLVAGQLERYERLDAAASAR